MAMPAQREDHTVVVVGQDSPDLGLSTFSRKRAPGLAPLPTTSRQFTTSTTSEDEVRHSAKLASAVLVYVFTNVEARPRHALLHAKRSIAASSVKGGSSAARCSFDSPKDGLDHTGVSISS
jgi:hypothetical protein